MIQGSRKSRGRAPRFGGDWTEAKLEVIARYLRSYTTALKEQPSKERPFHKAYIDAFAGTGYRETHRDDQGPQTTNLLLPDLAKREPQALLDGSARLALRTEPRFERTSSSSGARADARSSKRSRPSSHSSPRTSRSGRVRRTRDPGDLLEPVGARTARCSSSIPTACRSSGKTIEADGRDAGDRSLAALPARHRRQPPAHEVRRDPGGLAQAAGSLARHRGLVRRVLQGRDGRRPCSAASRSTSSRRRRRRSVATSTTG